MATRKAPSFLKRGRSCGFSMIELVIVLILVGILAVYAFPRMTTPQSITLPAVANQLIGNIRYAQNLSMSQGQAFPYGVSSILLNFVTTPPFSRNVRDFASRQVETRFKSSPKETALV